MVTQGAQAWQFDRKQKERKWKEKIIGIVYNGFLLWHYHGYLVSRGNIEGHVKALKY